MDTVTIPLVDGGEAIVDADRYDELIGYRWRLGTRGYVVRYTTPQDVFMHRYLMKCPPELEVDHKNGNPLDNRVDNLRVCTHQQNVANKRKQRGNYTSRFKGIWQTLSGTWRGRIECKGVRYALGQFATEEEAARAYDAKAIELFSEYAALNFPLEHQQTALR